MSTTSIANFVKFVRKQLSESAFAEVDHINLVEKYGKDDEAFEEIVSSITEHVEALIKVARITGNYPKKCNNKIEDDDLANILTKGFIYRRDVFADVREIEDEF